MRYSLRSQFSGTILGAIVGRSLSLDHGQQYQNVETFQTRPLQGLEMMTLGSKSLINLGRFDLSDWRKLNNQEFQNVDTLNIFPEIILATLPIALFFHENTIKLRENLLLSLQLWQDNPFIRDGVLAVGYAIAQSLTQKLSKTNLIAQTISFIGETSTNLPDQLIKVTYLLESKAGLEKAQTELMNQEKQSNAIAMAFYCFLDTLEDFRLSVLRATQIEGNLVGINTITGALSGAYNSTTSIPVNWQISMVQVNSAHVLELAESLLSVWSGVYDFEVNSSDSKKNDTKIIGAIASPGIIR